MPYIVPEERAKYDQGIDKLAQTLSLSADRLKPGMFNYVISKLISKGYKPQRYVDYNAVLGVLSAVTHEFYRRSISSYEDRKIQENGDL